MKNNKGFAPLILMAIVIGVLAIGGGAYYLGKSSGDIKKEIKTEGSNLSTENKIIENNSIVTKSEDSNKSVAINVDSCVSDKGSVMTYKRALEISKASSCNDIGKFTGEYSCNKNAGGLIDVFMSPSNKPNCSFACRVSIDTGKAEEGWMCTGALKVPVVGLKTYIDKDINFSRFSVSYPESSIIFIDGAGNISFSGSDSTLNPTTITKSINFVDDSNGKWGSYILSYDNGWIVKRQNETDGSLYSESITPFGYTTSGLPIFNGGSHHGFGWYSYIVALTHTKFLKISGPDTINDYASYNESNDPTFLITKSISSMIRF